MIDRLRAEFNKLADRVDELSLRERAIIFVGVLVVMYIATMQLVIHPLTDQRTRLQTQLKAKRDQIQSAELQIQAMLGGEAYTADANKKARIDGLREQIKAVEVELSKTTSGLVQPKEMARLVDRFLADRRGLQVVKIENLRPEPLLSGEARAEGGAEKTAASIYKHGMRVELRGTYIDMLMYLKALEQLPWKVFWGQVTFQSEQYPTSKMTLVIYTLSTREGWIGI
jgi:MSHA biogenesis protein MshJ